jgi:hypothetical protein
VISCLIGDRLAVARFLIDAVMWMRDVLEVSVSR